jgi:acetylornithine deacetylase/succinyl-diaminopimelate desuccinylase-like protein
MRESDWRDDAVALTSALIANACVNTGDPASGNEIASVRTIQEYLGEDGIVIEPLPGRASVVYRIAGTSRGAPRLLLIPHLDVVPADPTEWTHPPFEGLRSGGFVWGRGAVDMLNLTASMTCLYKAMRDGSIPPPVGDVILACVADEEAGGVYGASHLVEEHWDLVACDYVLTEVAGPTLHDDANGPALPVTVAEKGPAWRSVTSTGIAGHGSQPFMRSNAVLTLAHAFDRIGSADQPVLITDEWLRFLPHLPVDPGTRSMLADAETVDEAIRVIAESDPTLARWVHACTHLTFSPNVISGGTKSNVVPSHATGDIDVRLLPGQDAADINDHLRKVLGPDTFDDLEIAPVLEMAANGSPASGPLWDAIADAADHHIGTRTLAPSMTPVTTDARFFRARGIPSYGVGLFDDTVTLPEMLGMFHGADERVSEVSIHNTASFLATVVGRFSERVAPGP